MSKQQTSSQRALSSNPSNDTISRVCRGAGSLLEGEAVFAYIKQLEQAAHGRVVEDVTLQGGHCLRCGAGPEWLVGARK